MVINPYLTDWIIIPTIGENKIHVPNHRPEETPFLHWHNEHNNYTIPIYPPKKDNFLQCQALRVHLHQTPHESRVVHRQSQGLQLIQGCLVPLKLLLWNTFSNSIFKSQQTKKKHGQEQPNRPNTEDFGSFNWGVFSGVYRFLWLQDLSLGGPGKDDRIRYSHSPGQTPPALERRPPGAWAMVGHGATRFFFVNHGEEPIITMVHHHLWPWGKKVLGDFWHPTWGNFFSPEVGLEGWEGPSFQHVLVTSPISFLLVIPLGTWIIFGWIPSSNLT